MKTLWIGRVFTGLLSVPFLMGAVMVFSGKPEVAAGMEKIGIPATLARPLGVIELVCAIIYLIPQTTVLGAVLLTGYLGGAILTHIRVGESFVIPLVIGLLVWLGPYLREPRLRDLLPLRK